MLLPRAGTHRGTCRCTHIPAVFSLSPLCRSLSGFFLMFLATREFLSTGKDRYCPLSPPGLLHLLVDSRRLFLFFFSIMNSGSRWEENTLVKGYKLEFSDSPLTPKR